MPMTAAERNARYLKNKRVKRDPKFFLIEAYELLDRIIKIHPNKAEELLHTLRLEIARLERKLARIEKGK
jgi:hypothetical protein